MSRGYVLVCRRCKRALSLGKVGTLSQGGESQNVFSGIYTKAGDQPHRADAVFAEVVERLLILHRNHPLVCMPDGTLDFIPDVDREFEFVTADELLAAMSEPAVNWYDEVDDWRRQHEQGT